MASIKSDITNRNFVSSSFREIEVPDQSFEDQQNESYQRPASIEEINRSLISRGLPPIDEQSYFEGPPRPNNNMVQQNRAAQQGPTPHYTNNNEDSFAEMERKISMAKKMKSGLSQDKLSDAAKKRIEMLCGMSRNVKEIDIHGNAYVLRTLKSKEILEALISASKMDGSISLPFQTRKEFLARSLIKIAGTDVALFLGDNSIEARLEFLDELDEPLLEKLYREYTTLVNEVNSSYGLNDQRVAEGVPEDIKK